MVIEIAPLLLVGLVGAVVLAGAITGIAGFGFALVGTMVLATVIDPATAVVVLIAPILAVNLSLVGELTFEDVISCTQRFWPLVLFAFVGTLGGMALLDWLPQGVTRSRPWYRCTCLRWCGTTTGTPARHNSTARWLFR